jgi:serine/threonine protein kinase
MHRHKIIHRDLKGCNIVSHNGIYKICDFGFAKEMKEGLVYTCLGTVSNMALEVLLQKPYGIKVHLLQFRLIFGHLG